MFIHFFLTLRAARLKVSVKEYLILVEGVKAGLLDGEDGVPSVDRFYDLARLTLVKDETQFDKFDRAFAAYFRGVESLTNFTRELSQAWLRNHLALELSPEERRLLEQDGGWDELMQALKERLDEQTERHAGGNRMIGTAGTSPFGAQGDNPRGVRIGQQASRRRSAVRTWDRRQFKDYDDTRELGTRQVQLALRRLRRYAREGAAEELDLDGTIRATAANAGHLDIRMVPERHNKARVLLLMDVGGTMDEHVQRVETLFSAAKSEFKHLSFWYFHNCVYDHLWKNNRRRHSEKFSTWDLLHTYNRDHRLIFVGDATMSPYEILQPGGSLEHPNAEAGAEWLQRLTQAFPKFAWINPEPQGLWPYRQSVAIVENLMHRRMFPLTLQGLEGAMRLLSR